MRSNHRPCVSIGLPVYNGEPFLQEALDSLLNQTFEDFELILSDNASTDNTPEICESFARLDPRIRYVRNESNLGAAQNYNRVFHLAQGEFFKWASHDDVCAPTYLERCVEVLKENSSIILCYPKTLIIDEVGKVVSHYDDHLDLTSVESSERLKQYLRRAEGRECNAIFGLIRTPVLAQTPLIGNYNASDAVLLAYLILLGQFYEIPEELFFRRDHPQTSIRASQGNGEDIATWFDPSKKGKLILPNCRKAYEYVKCTQMTTLDRISRIRCLLQVGRWLWLRKARLGYEVLISIWKFLGEHLRSRMRGGGIGKNIFG